MKHMNRWLALVAMLAMMLVALVGCANQTATDPTEVPTTEAPTAAPAATAAETDKPAVTAEATPEVVTYKQSPFLDGKGLPDVADRLPKVTKLPNQMALSELNYVNGKYGGTLRTLRVAPNYDATYMLMNTVPLLNSPSLLGEEVTPNIVEDYQVSEDNREFTFKLREGLKWSDGVPVTMEDVKFAIEDFQFNETVNPGGIPAWLRSQGRPGEAPVKFEVIDDWTFKMSFEKPYGGLLLSMAVEGWRNYLDLIKPKHYMKQFHADYTPLEELEPLIAELGFEPGDWRSLFNAKDLQAGSQTQEIKALGFPQLTPWIMVEYGDVATYERNPYYFKVDSDGQQLPYIDRIVSTFVNSVEMANLKLFSGEADHSYEWAVMSKVAMYIESEPTSGLKTYTSTTLHRTAHNFMMSLTFEDPTWQSAVSNVDFRKAVNMSINRDEIVNSVFMGYAKPYEKQNNYDLEAAKKLLDDIGMTLDSNGNRLAPDGKKLTIAIDNRSDAMADGAEQGELMVSYLQDLGINASMKQIDGGLWDQRQNANELTAGMFFVPGPVMWFRPEWHPHIWAQLWHQWNQSAGEKGEEPTEEGKAFLDNLNNIRTSTPEEAHKVWEKLVDSNAQNYWFFIPTQDVVQPVAIRATIRNFDNKGYAIANNIAAEQWWFDE